MVLKHTSRKHLFLTWLLLVCLFPRWAQAQAPGLLWSTNLGARLFAVDAQTNVYANSGGTVFTINSAGVPVSTNTVCSVTSAAPVSARLDGSGNYYFLGNFDGTQNFGGIVLVGGWTNWPSPGHWTRGYPTCFLAKYSSGGALQWVVSFGGQAVSNSPTDLLVDLSGNAYPAYVRPNGSGYPGVIASVSSSGAKQWETVVSDSNPYSSGVTLGGLTSSNFCFFDFRNAPVVEGGRIDVSGNAGFWGKAGSNYIGWATPAAMNGKPVIDDDAQAFQAGVCNPNCVSHQVVRKWAVNGSEALTVPLGAEEQWTLARDAQANVYLGGAAALFAKYSSDAILIWTTNYGQMPAAMLVDGVGNRFLGFANGAVARVAADFPPQPPQISSDPQSQTVFLGDSASLFVSATGTQPLRYSWRLNTTNILGVTTSSLVFNSAALSDAGAYTAVITNAAGSVTSAPAQLRVKLVELYAGSQMLSAGAYFFSSPPTLSIRSAFTNGSAFYTLDGSAPSFASVHYTGPFTLQSSATVRALGYSADFSQSEEADPVYATVLASHTLTVASSGGGQVNGASSGTYSSTNVFTLVATPLPGWSFLYWLGDASGTNASISVAMDRDKTLYAVFGTTLSTTVAGNGQVLRYPDSGLYPFGSTVRLTGVPQPGYYFGFWGNAATGDTNPLYFAISAPTQTVSSIFGAVPAGQAALTVEIVGNGQVAVNPRANVYPTTQSVTLTASPGQSFLYWSGDASGGQNPLTVTMNQSRVITANFSGRPTLRVSVPGLEGLTPAGFRLTLLSDPQLIWQILGSTNFTTWEVLGTVTNTEGQVQFTDPGALIRPRRFYRAAPGP